MFGLISNDISKWSAGDFGFLNDWNVQTPSESFSSNGGTKRQILSFSRVQGLGWQALKPLVLPDSCSSSYVVTGFSVKEDIVIYQKLNFLLYFPVRGQWEA